MSDMSGKTVRCQIPQEAFLSGAMYIVSAYNNDAIVDAYRFKNIAKEGAQSLDHNKFVNLIQEHIDILHEAMEINKIKNEDEKNDH